MSLSLRLRALELLARTEGLITREPPCPECRGPRPKVYGGVVIDVSAGETLNHCSRCSRPLDEKGLALGEHGSVLYLHRERADVPMPGAEPPTS